MITPAQIAEVQRTFPAWDDMTARRHLQQRAALSGERRAPRYSATWCSQCGAALGPGDAGVSDCRQHPLESLS